MHAVHLSLQCITGMMHLTTWLEGSRMCLKAHMHCKPPVAKAAGMSLMHGMHPVANAAGMSLMHCMHPVANAAAVSCMHCMHSAHQMLQQGLDCLPPVHKTTDRLRRVAGLRLRPGVSYQALKGLHALLASFNCAADTKQLSAVQCFPTGKARQQRFRT